MCVGLLSKPLIFFEIISDDPVVMKVALFSGDFYLKSPMFTMVFFLKDLRYELIIVVHTLVIVLPVNLSSWLLSIF